MYATYLCFLCRTPDTDFVDVLIKVCSVRKYRNPLEWLGLYSKSHEAENIATIYIPTDSLQLKPIEFIPWIHLLLAKMHY